MKKGIILAAAVSLIASLALTVSAADSLNLKVGDAEAGANVNEIVVPVSITENPGITVLRVQIDYPSDILELVDVKDMDNLGSNVHGDTYSNDPYILYWNNNMKLDNYMEQNIELAELTFRVKDDAVNGEYKINLTTGSGDVLNGNIESVPYTIENGTVIIHGHKEGSAPAAQEKDPEPVHDPKKEDPVPVDTKKDEPKQEEPKNETRDKAPEAKAEVNEKVVAVSESTEWENPFRDVSTGDEYYDAVKFVNINNLFNGTSATTFEPDTTMTRAMFVTVLGRLAGVDQTKYNYSNFDDVNSSTDPAGWFTPYVAWAQENNIVNGVGYMEGVGSNCFNPTGKITIEQAAVIIARYAEFTGRDMSSSDEQFWWNADANEVSSWAVSQMKWALSHGIYSPKSYIINPLGEASRALVATMLYNYTGVFCITKN